MFGLTRPITNALQNTKRDSRHRSARVKKTIKKNEEMDNEDERGIPTTTTTTTTTTNNNNNNSKSRRWLMSTAVGAILASKTSKGIDVNERAEAIQSEIELRDISYKPADCPENQYLPSKKTAMCVEFTATATTKKAVSAANVFGFVDDYDGNSAATNNETGTSRVVLSQIDREIPVGTSQVTFIVTVFKESYNKGKFKLRGFKAIEANEQINKRFVPLGECDIDPAAPGCPDEL